MSGCHHASISHFISVSCCPGNGGSQGGPVHLFPLAFQSLTVPTPSTTWPRSECPRLRQPALTSGCWSTTLTAPYLLPLGSYPASASPATQAVDSLQVLATLRNCLEQQPCQAAVKRSSALGPQDEVWGAPAATHGRSCLTWLLGPLGEPPEAPGTKDSSCVRLPGRGAGMSH